MRTSFWGAAAALMLSHPGIALGQQADPAAIIEAARERARKIEEMKAALNDPDATVRLAVLEAMLSSADGLMRDIAFEAGLVYGCPGALLDAQACLRSTRQDPVRRLATG